MTKYRELQQQQAKNPQEQATVQGVPTLKITPEDYEALSRKVVELQREKEELTRELARMKDQRESVAMKAENQGAGVKANQ